MESQLRTMDNLIEYATINLYISEVETYTPIVEPGMGERISTGFKNSIEDVVEGFKNLIVFVVVNSPFFVIFVVVVLLLVLFIRLIVKITIKKVEANEEKKILEQKARAQSNGKQ